jgi:hypothetical protein
MAVFAIQINQQTQGRVPLSEIKEYLLQDRKYLNLQNFLIFFDIFVKFLIIFSCS